MIETERLILREYTLDDFEALYEIMSDPETMQHYPAPFDKDRTMGWITWNLDNYKKYGRVLLQWKPGIQAARQRHRQVREARPHRGLRHHYSEH